MQEPVNKALHVFLPSVPILRIKPAAGQLAGFDLPLRSDPGVFQSVRKVIPEFPERSLDAVNEVMDRNLLSSAAHSSS